MKIYKHSSVGSYVMVHLHKLLQSSPVKSIFLIF